MSDTPRLTQIIIFGASGDLTARKLIPALLGNSIEGAFPGLVQVIGTARRSKTDDQWRHELARWIGDDQKTHWPEFSKHVFYEGGDVLSGGAPALKARLDSLAEEAGQPSDQVRRLFYLALAPKLFQSVIAALSEHNMLSCLPGRESGMRRVIVEKPFGTDLKSAEALNRALLTYLREDQILRIDHYLGKETVQNLLAFRFQNAIFEPLWSYRHVQAVEISVCEALGMESGRGGYYDTAGALRDMVQNHLLQILSLVAMEAPASMEADAVRNEKVKLLSSLTAMSPEQVARHVVRAQYTGHDGIKGYLEEDGVAPDSQTESYVAIRAQIHNWRWSGVPFLLRSGKRLARRFTEVVLHFHTPPVDLFSGPAMGDICRLRPNKLRILIQPEEGFRLSFLVKQPGSARGMRQADLGMDYADLMEGPSAPAYQRLLLDAVEGNATLFIRGDEVEGAWRFADAIRAGWEANPAPPMHTYVAGSEGPTAADQLFWDSHGAWSTGQR